MYDTPSGQALSPCRDYRYAVWRAWGPEPPLHFLLLNPSTADAAADEPAVLKCAGFAKRLAASGVLVTSLFALRSNEPAELDAEDSIGPGNDTAILEAADRAVFTVCGWGDRGGLKGRGSEVRRLLAGRPVYAFGLGKTGEPTHPLRVTFRARLTPLGPPA